MHPAVFTIYCSALLAPGFSVHPGALYQEMISFGGCIFHGPSIELPLLLIMSYHLRLLLLSSDFLWQHSLCLTSHIPGLRWSIAYIFMQLPFLFLAGIKRYFALWNFFLTFSSTVAWTIVKIFTFPPTDLWFLGWKDPEELWSFMKRLPYAILYYPIVKIQSF